MKRIIQRALLAVALAIGSFAAFAGGSNPGLYYGQIPTAAQWNSYFAAKLDYTPGAVNTIPYWDGSGNQLNALISGDCTSAANVFTCNANNINGGTQWGVLYQSASGVTASTAAGSAGQVLTSNATSAPTFQDIGNPFAASIHAATNKTTPVGADEVGIWDSVSGLINRVSFTNMLTWFAAKAGNVAQAFSASNFITAQGLTFPATQNPSADANTFDDYKEGTVTLTLTGCTTAPTIDFRYVKIGRKIMLSPVTSAITATSNATTKTLTGLPAGLAPVMDTYLLGISSDNGGARTLSYSKIDTTGLITLYTTINLNQWTASGTMLWLPPTIELYSPA